VCLFVAEAGLELKILLSLPSAGIVGMHGQLKDFSIYTAATVCTDFQPSPVPNNKISKLMPLENVLFFF
jgi:hypothetical protein